MNRALTIAVACLAAFISVEASASDFLADRHVARKLTCESCHNGTAVKKNAKDQEVCVDCHGDYDKMYAKVDAKYTKLEMTNPHGQHDGNLPCSSCHKGHQKSVNYCLGCHSFEFKVP